MVINMSIKPIAGMYGLKTPPQKWVNVHYCSYFTIILLTFTSNSSFLRLFLCGARKWKCSNIYLFLGTKFGRFLQKEIAGVLKRVWFFSVLSKMEKCPYQEIAEGKGSHPYARHRNTHKCCWLWLSNKGWYSCKSSLQFHKALWLLHQFN